MMVPGKKVAVLGLGVSGFESARFLKTQGLDVFATDQGSSAVVLERAETLREAGIRAETGGHTESEVLASDWVLISPGIPPSSAVYQKVRSAGLPLVSEIEAASWFCPPGRVIAVTGSSGKTTVSTLLHRTLSRAGRAFLCGNIGNPWIGELAKIRPGDFVVLEVSSFQLMHCRTFSPHVGVLLNLSPNHQDWHEDMRDYAAAKLRLFQNQRASDYAVYRRADEAAFFQDFPFKGKKIYFGEDPAQNPNEEAVRLVAGLLMVDQAHAEEAIRGFEGIEHRLERFASAGGVQFVNDSKSTTTASLAWALSKCPDQSVVLVAGGHPKSDDFHTIRELVRRKVRRAVLIGEARGLLRDAWGIEGFETCDFREAVKEAVTAARAGDTVLLSPACASFDMFANYIERGLLFKQQVRQLISQRATSEISQ